MRIKSVEIKGFKSIDFTGIRFTVDNIAAFIGKNSTGKSNLLEALECFFYNRTLTVDDYHCNNTGSSIEITVAFTLDENDYKFDLLSCTNKKGILQIRKIFACGAKPTAEVVGSWCYSSEDIFNPYIKYTAASFKKIITTDEVQSFLKNNFSNRTITTHDQYITALKEYWERCWENMPKKWDDTIVQPLSKELAAALPQYYYLPVTYTVDDETKLGKNSRFQIIYNHILGSIESILNDTHIQKIEKHIDQLYRKAGIEKRRKNVNKLLASIDNTGSQTRMHLEFSPIDLKALSQRTTTLMIDDGYDSNVASKGHGIQRDSIFRLLQAYLQLADIQNKANFILAIDEPELYMHPTYKRALYASFIDLSKRGCQVFYTTHDPAFVSVARFDDIHIVRKEQVYHHSTTVANCSLKKIKTTSAFKKACKSKSDSAIRLELQHKCHGEQNEGFFADRVIIVEGATEQYALPIYFDKIGYNLDTANVAIVTAESVTLVAQLCTIFSALGLPCYCIFDGDKPKDKDYQEYLLYLNGELGEVSQSKSDSLKGVSRSLSRNKYLIKFLSNEEISEFQPTTIATNYTMWEHNFEIDVHEKIRGYKKLHEGIISAEGISKDSKPLIAAAIAGYYAEKKQLPKHLNETMRKIADNIRHCSQVPLQEPSPINTITIHNDSAENLLPIFSCAAGRNTYLTDDEAIGFAEGKFPSAADCLFHIQGNSMEPLIPNNSYVAVQRTETPNPGDFVICMIGSGEMVCKQYIQYTKSNQQISLLKSHNPKSPDIEYSGESDALFRGIVLTKSKTPVYYLLEDQ